MAYAQNSSFVIRHSQLALLPVVELFGDEILHGFEGAESAE
jgi:hypothetical protein